MRKKLMMTMLVCSFALVCTLAFFAEDADAIPVFARKYGLSCNSCHTMFPKLTKMGVAFRERGFRFAAGRDDLDMQAGPGKNADLGDKAIVPSNFPFTLRTQILYSGAGPIEGVTAAGQVVPAMPGHQFGMLDGALIEDPATGRLVRNFKFGFGELGLISSGSYDNWFWWLDANQNGIGMLEGGYYVSDLLKIRVGRVQTNVGYGMTMMSRRPLGFGTVDAAIMNGGTMLMMGDGVAIHGTTDGDTGIGTAYNLAYFNYGKNTNLNNRLAQGVFARLAQEIMGDHIVGIYYYQAKNWSSDLMGGESAMYMNMMGVATPMTFTDVSRYGVDFAINYGEPLQAWGAFTFGKNRNAAGKTLKVKAFTVAGEWIFSEGLMIGGKWDYSQAELQMGGMPKFKPKATQHLTLYGAYQIAENVQAIASATRTSNLVTNAGMTLAGTTLQDFTTGLMAVDLAF